MKNLALLFVAVLSLPAAGCKKQGGGSSDALARMTALKDRMCACKDAACAQQVSDELNRWATDQAKTKDAPKMSEADTKKATEVGQQMGKCMQQAMTPAGAPGGSAQVGSAGSGGSQAPSQGASELPSECAEYRAAVDKLAACDKLPKESRDSLKSAYDTAAAGWASLPPEGKAALKDSCKGGLEAVTNAAKSTCGW